MPRAIVFAGCALLIACQRQTLENTALPQQRDTEQARAAGWTIDEMMKVRDVDDVHISPDGRQVLFVVRTAVLSGDQGQYLTQVYSANADGTHERSVTESNYSATGAEWSPDGRWIAFLSDRSGRSAGNTIWLVPGEGGKPRPIDVGGSGVVNIKWSPDGTKVALTMPAPATPGQVEAQQHPGAPQVVDANIRKMDDRKH